MTAERPDEPADQAADREALYPAASAIRHAYIVAGQAYLARRTGLESDFGSKSVPKWDGGFDPKTGRHFEPIWYGIAAVAAESRVHPEDLVAAAFDDWEGTRPPDPMNMANPKLAARAREQAELEVARIANAWKSQVNAWKLEASIKSDLYKIDEDAAARRALRDLHLPLVHVFRYCMATSAGDHETAAMFEQGAVIQYLASRRAYDLAWPDRIPTRLKELADAAP